MTPEETLASYRSALAEVGEDIAIRRYTGTGPVRPHTDTAARARIVGYLPQELVGAIVQGDRKAIVLVDAAVTAVLPVLTTDKLVVRGKEMAIKSVDDSSRRMAGTLIALEIHAAG